MTDTKQLEERDRFKTYFEQNLLDGDKLDDSGHTMLRADDVFEVVSEYITREMNRARQDEVGSVQMTYGLKDTPVRTSAGGKFQSVEERYEELEASLIPRQGEK